MSDASEYVIDLGPVAVRLRTRESWLAEYLGCFYEVESAATARTVAWAIEATVGTPGAGMARNRWGVGWRAAAGAREVAIVGPDRGDVAITVRKLVREALVEYCEERGATMLHASAVLTSTGVVIIAGDKGAGKTTLALSAVFDLGATLLSNDHLLLYRGADDALVLTSLPTPIPVKVGTWCDWAERLGRPWDVDGVTLAGAAAAAGLPAEGRYQTPGRLLYTYRDLGQPNPLHIGLDDRIQIVLASYAGAGEDPGQPEPVVNPAAALSEHVRYDWWFGEANSNLLGRQIRSAAQFAADSADRLGELAALGRTLRWSHRGHLGPLQEDTGPGARQ